MVKGSGRGGTQAAILPTVGGDDINVQPQTTATVEPLPSLVQVGPWRPRLSAPMFSTS